MFLSLCVFLCELCGLSYCCYNNYSISLGTGVSFGYSLTSVCFGSSLTSSISGTGVSLLKVSFRVQLLSFLLLTVLVLLVL